MDLKALLIKPLLSNKSLNSLLFILIDKIIGIDNISYFYAYKLINLSTLL